MKLLTQISKELADYIVEKSKTFKHYKKTGTTHEYIAELANVGAMAFVSTDSNERINGVLVFYISTLLPTFRGQRVAIEHLWFSEGGTGKQLLEAFEDYAKNYEHCTHIIMSMHHGNKAAAKLPAFFENKGYEPCETTYIKELA